MTSVRCSAMAISTAFVGTRSPRCHSLRDVSGRKPELGVWKAAVAWFLKNLTGQLPIIRPMSSSVISDRVHAAPEARHLNISDEKRQIHPLRLNHRLSGVLGAGHLVAGHLQPVHEQVADDFIIIDDEDKGSFGRHDRRRGRRFGRRLRPVRRRSGSGRRRDGLIDVGGRNALLN